MSDMVKCSKSVLVANDAKILSEGTGNVVVKLDNSGTEEVKTITNCMYVPKLSSNLLSVSQSAKKGHVLVFDSAGLRAYNRVGFLCSGDIEFTGTLKDDLYMLDLCKPKSKVSDQVRASTSQVSEPVRASESDVNPVNVPTVVRESGVVEAGGSGNVSNHDLWHKRQETCSFEPKRHASAVWTCHWDATGHE